MREREEEGKEEDKEEEEVGKVWRGRRRRRQPGLNSFIKISLYTSHDLRALR